MDAVVVVDRVWEAYRSNRRPRWPGRGGVRWALQDVSLSVAPGEMLGIVGGNGSGKTTLLQVVAGVLAPTRGQVHRRGRVVSLVEPTSGFHRDLTGRENVLVGAVLLGLTRSQAKARYDQIVALAGLEEDALAAPVRTYSEGMAMRLGFSLAVHAEPAVLVVDEVLAVVDDAFRATSMAMLHRLRREGVAVLHASHDLDLVAEHCDRVAVLEGGAVTVSGPPGEALARYRRSAVAAPATGR